MRSLTLPHLLYTVFAESPVIRDWGMKTIKLIFVALEKALEFLNGDGPAAIKSSLKDSSSLVYVKCQGPPSCKLTRS